MVSDIGETWSPNIPPLITAPTIRGVYISKFAPKAKAIGIIIENVPQLVPVEKEVIEATKNIMRGRVEGSISASRIVWDRYSAVPKSLII